MRTTKHKNIQVLIQVQLIYSLPFVTTMKKKEKYDDDEKDTSLTEFSMPSVPRASRVQEIS